MSDQERLSRREQEIAARLAQAQGELDAGATGDKAKEARRIVERAEQLRADVEAIRRLVENGMPLNAIRPADQEVKKDKERQLDLRRQYLRWQKMQGEAALNDIQRERQAWADERESQRGELVHQVHDGLKTEADLEKFDEETAQAIMTPEEHFAQEVHEHSMMILDQMVEEEHKHLERYPNRTPLRRTERRRAQALIDGYGLHPDAVAARRQRAADIREAIRRTQSQTQPKTTRQTRRLDELTRRLKEEKKK